MQNITLMQNKHTQLKSQNFVSRHIWHLAWKRGGAILKGKHRVEVSEKGKYKQEKKEASRKNEKEASDTVNKHVNKQSVWLQNLQSV